MVAVWRGMDRERLDREYNARATVVDFEGEMGRYRAASARARETLGVERDLVFEGGGGCGLDWFRGEQGGAVLLWAHGGYWRALSKEDNSCVAPGLVGAGVHVAVMDYSLAPAVSLDVIVGQVRAAYAFVVREAGRFGADAGRVFVGGSSAGGHLAGMLVAERREIAGAVCLSGLFDLEPVRLSHVNAWLGLDAAGARRLSPLHQIPAGGQAARVMARYGGLETAEFARQSEEFAAAWRGAGHVAEAGAAAGLHHFDIVLALGDPLHDLCRDVVRFIRG